LRLEVLGCAGGELPAHRTTCFLLDDTLALDAGALTVSLPLERLDQLDDIVLTHGHFDHVKDVPLLADLLVGRRDRPVVVHASGECARTLREHVFNGRLWPDFTRIPDARSPVIEIRAFEDGRPFRAGRFELDPVRMAHTVESTGYVVSDGASAIAISGDTGPTRAFWERVNAVEGLRALLVETSFPSRLQALADASGHLTPRTLQGELAKLDRPGVPVLLYHLKPAFADEVRAEIGALHPDVRILSTGDRFTF
jgi:ribonuclease BN (tRNA processing enzyme)